MVSLTSGVAMIALSDGSDLAADVGESVDLFATFTDADGASVNPTDLATVLLTIKRVGSGPRSDWAVVNSIENTNIDNTGRGTIDGTTLDIRLDPSDVVLAGDSDELHEATVTVTYHDGVGTRTGIQRGRYWVRA